MLPRDLHAIDPTRGQCYAYVCDASNIAGMVDWMRRGLAAGVLQGAVVILSATDCGPFEQVTPTIIATSLDYIRQVDDPHYHEHEWVDVSDQYLANIENKS